MKSLERMTNLSLTSTVNSSFYHVDNFMMKVPALQIRPGPWKCYLEKMLSDLIKKLIQTF